MAKKKHGPSNYPTGEIPQYGLPRCSAAPPGSGKPSYPTRKEAIRHLNRMLGSEGYRRTHPDYRPRTVYRCKTLSDGTEGCGKFHLTSMTKSEHEIATRGIRERELKQAKAGRGGEYRREG